MNFVNPIHSKINHQFEQNALHTLRAHSPYGTPLENHCLRLHSFTCALAVQNHIELDPHIVKGACYLHDIGLLVKDHTETNYLKRGSKFIAPLLKEWGLSDFERKIVDDVMHYSHALKSISGISPVGDLVNQAVGIEHSLGLFRHGLSRKRIKDIFEEFPRLGFGTVLVGFFKTVAVDDDIRQLPKIFFPDNLTHL